MTKIQEHIVECQKLDLALQKNREGLSGEVASEAQPPEAVSPSATGCRGATAPSNPEADSSVRCRDKAEPVAAGWKREHDKRVKLYNAACKYAEYVWSNRHDYDEAMRLADTLEQAAIEFADYAAAGAPPCGERARLDNDELCHSKQPKNV